VSGDRTRSYTYCGLRLRSEIDLHLPPSTACGWDVDIRWGAEIHNSGEPPPGEVIAVYDSSGTSWYTATSVDSGYVLRIRNCGEFNISADLSEVCIRPDPAGRHELLPILLAGTGMSFILTLRGATVLHASAVAVDGSALAFVGQSGRGKSTLAALLCVETAALVTDDVLAVEAGPPVTCVGGAREVRLRGAASAIADALPGGAIRATADDRLALTPALAPSQPLPLAAIVIPAPSRTASVVEVRSVPPTEALFALISFPRVHGWRRPDVLRRDFDTLSRIVNLIPVYDVTIPWGPPFDPGVPRSLAELATPAAAPTSA
jgi:hypothetical protein